MKLTKLLTITVLLLLSFNLLAATATGEQGVFDSIFDFFDDFKTLFTVEVPSAFERFYAWFLLWKIKAEIFAYYHFVQFSAGIAKQLMLNFNVMSQITASINLLPSDLRQVLVDTRLLDGLNIIIQAYVTRFVMSRIR